MRLLEGFDFSGIFANEVFWEYFWKVVVSIVLFIVMLVTAAVVRRMFARAAKKEKIKDEARTRLSLFKSLTVALVYVFFAAVIISLYPQLKVLGTSLLAGSGIAVLAVSLAAQDAISNVIGGFFISMFQPFKIGDVITYTSKNITGVVEEISIRHTVIRTYDNRRLIVPNGLINKESIENSTFGDSKLCVYMDLGISYSADIGKAMDIIEDEIVHHRNYFDPRTPEQIADGVRPAKVFVLKWADSAVILRACVWGKTPDLATDATRDLYRSIKERFDREGVEIPYPYINVINKGENE